MCVDHIGLGSVAQQEGDTLHMVRKSCSMKGGPAPTQTHLMMDCVQLESFHINMTSFRSHLPLESVALTMVVPIESINISATPSLSFILKHTTYAVIEPQCNVSIQIFTGTDGQMILHSTVQWTERVALNLLEHLLVQQHLHTRIVS